MRIVHDVPPNFDEISATFDIAGKAMIFAWCIRHLPSRWRGRIMVRRMNRAFGLSKPDAFTIRFD